MWNSPILITSLSEKELLYKQISWALARMTFWSTTITISFCFSVSTIAVMLPRAVWTGRLHEITGRLPTFVEGRVEPFFNISLNLSIQEWISLGPCVLSKGRMQQWYGHLYICTAGDLPWAHSVDLTSFLFCKSKDVLEKNEQTVSCSLSGQCEVTPKCLNNSHGLLNLSLVLCVIPLTESVSSMKSLLSKRSATGNSTLCTGMYTAYLHSLFVGDQGLYHA